MTELDSLITKLSELRQPPSGSASHTLPPLTENPTARDKLHGYIHHLLSEGQLHQQHNAAAHMTAPLSTDSLFGQLISSLHNGNLLSPELYPILADIEQQTLQFLCELFDQNHGHFTAGSSYGNLEALWQAKQKTPSKQHVYASSASHHSVQTACNILGLTFTAIPYDPQGSLDTSALKKACQQRSPLAIIATAGTPAIGQFDPLDDCAALAQRYSAWYHIDAAWGGSLKLLPEYNSLFEQALSKADSLCFDPHKAWAQPKPSSVLLYQQPTEAMFSQPVDYLSQVPKQQIHGSRGGEHFLPLWYSLHTDGIEGLRQFCRSALEQATQFTQALAEETAWPITTSPTGIVCFNTECDLDTLVSNGTLSKAQHNDETVYRVTFIGKNTNATELMTALRPYF